MKSQWGCPPILWIVTNWPNQNKHENVTNVSTFLLLEFIWYLVIIFYGLLHLCLSSSSTKEEEERKKKEAFCIAFSMILLRVLSEKNGLRLVAYIMLLVTL